MVRASVFYEGVSDSSLARVGDLPVARLTQAHCGVMQMSPASFKSVPQLTQRGSYESALQLN